MVKKHADAGTRAGAADPLEPGKARVELEFDRPTLLGSLFGQFDQNLITIENRLGVYIAARGNKVGKSWMAACEPATGRKLALP